ncbi:MAG: 4Fe-4S dicluster domain-containing protein [Gammaproteobacteria bacterium]
MVVDAANGNEDVTMDRREFFKAGIQQTSKTAVQIADEYVTQRAYRWIRPPYALDELEFLLACTRCDKCVEACPHKVIFTLPARLGVQVAGTPALDLLNKGCHLCSDWPCIEVCEPKALRYPELEKEEPRPLPQIAYAEINTQTCLPYSGPECSACAHACPVPGAMIWEKGKPRINPETCTGCGLCREECIVELKAIDIRSLLQPDSY